MSRTSTVAGAATTNAIDARIARLLRAGTRLGVALLAVGSILLVAAGGSPLAASWAPFDLAALPAGLVALQPEAYLWLGLLVTISTPLLRVGAATLAFARAGELRMVVLGVAVLVVIALAVVAGSAGG